MLWFWAALGASILWGISYALSDYTLKNGMSATAQLAFSGIVLTPVYTALALQNGTLQQGFKTLKSNPKTIWFLLAVFACYCAANILTYWSIKQKNATLSSMIEISYPLFTALFVYLFFRENQLSMYSFAGGLLIMSGIALIYYAK